MRQCWEGLYPTITRRSLDPDYEAAWLNAAGFFLRPGFGVSLDDYRLDRLWSLHELGICHPEVKAVKEQWYILWRRVGAGLSRQQQTTLFRENLLFMQGHAKRAQEAYRMASSFERLAMEDKSVLFDLLMQGLAQKAPKYRHPYLWSLGRLLSRVPLCAAEDAVVPPHFVHRVFDFFKDKDWKATGYEYASSLMALACRKTRHRALDISADLRKEVLEKMRESGAADRLMDMVNRYIPVSNDDLQLLLGESLPSGLNLKSF